MNIPKILRVAAAVLAFAMCGSAYAQLFRAYLSVSGSDANACTLAAPCRLLPAALAAVANGGEIWMLNSANYNTGTVSVTKSVSILAIPGALGSVVSTGGGDALQIATSFVTVALRNLVIRASGASQHGIHFDQPANLEVDGCEIIGMAGAGLDIPTVAFVTVRNTTIRDSQTGVQVSDGTLSLEGVRLVSNADGLIASGSSRVTIADSVIAGNASNGILVIGSGAHTSRAVIDNSVITGSNNGVNAAALGGEAEVTISRSHFAHNSTAVSGGILAGSVTVVVDGNVVTENTVGFSVNGGTIYTRGNNTLRFNTTDVVGDPLTPMTGN